MCTNKNKRRFNKGIKIKDSIRQGGVLSVLQYATVMDEIAKEIQKLNKGIKIPQKKRKNRVSTMDGRCPTNGRQ